MEEKSNAVIFIINKIEELRKSCNRERKIFNLIEMSKIHNSIICINNAEINGIEKVKEAIIHLYFCLNECAERGFLTFEEANEIESKFKIFSS